MINDINIRVKEVRLSMNLSQAKFANKIGFSQGGIKDVEIGKCKVTDRLILSMTNRLGVSEEWLRTGTGTMYAQQEADKDEVKEFADKMNLSETERKILSIYLKLSDTDRKKLEDFACSFAKKMAEESKKTAPDKKSEAAGLKVAESAAQYKGISEPEKEDFIKALEQEQATKGKSSVSPTDDGENVV